MKQLSFVLIFLLVFSGTCIVVISELYAENQTLKQENTWFKELSKLDKGTIKEIRTVITNSPVI